MHYCGWGACNFHNGDARNKGIQIGDHEIKIVNFADESTIFLRDFSFLTKTELILELPQKASSLKINFLKKQTLWDVAYKTRTDKIRQMNWSQFSIKMVGVYFHNSAHDNRKWQFNKKSSYSEQNAALFLWEEKTINQILW